MRISQKSISVLTLFLINSALLISQENREATPDNDGIALRIDGIAFFRNTEYFNKITEGYTLPGWTFSPDLVWSPGEKTKVALGTHVIYYPGSDKKLKPELKFSISRLLSDKITLFAGSLPGGDTHKLPDPLFSKEKLYTDNTENGIELIAQGKIFSSDTWIDWRKPVFKGDTIREEFTAGQTIKLSLPIADDKIRAEIPLSTIFNHWGGQVSNYNEHVLTTVNFTGGLRTELNLPGKSRNVIFAEYTAFVFRELTKKGDFGITSGTANWIKAGVIYSSFEFYAGYWRGDNFYSPLGNPIFGSVPDYEGGILTKERSLVTIYSALDRRMGESLSVLLSFEGYYDTSARRFDNALTLHLRVTDMFRLNRKIREQ